MTPNCNKLKYYLAPGIWVDLDGGVHIAIPDVLASLGMENTPENHRQIRQIAEELFREHPQTKLVHRYDEDGRPNAETREFPKE